MSKTLDNHDKEAKALVKGQDNNFVSSEFDVLEVVQERAKMEQPSEKEGASQEAKDMTKTLAPLKEGPRKTELAAKRDPENKGYSPVSGEFNILEEVVQQRAKARGEPQLHPPSQELSVDHSQQSEPGAYSGAPGQGLTRTKTARFSQVGLCTKDLASAELTESMDPEAKSLVFGIGHEEPSGLEEEEDPRKEEDTTVVEARPINEEEEEKEIKAYSTHAEPVDLKAQEKRTSEHQAARKRQLIGMVVVALLVFLVIAIVLGIVLKQESSKTTRGSISSQATDDQQSEETLATVSPTTLSLVEHLGLNDLPQDTLQSLQDPFSPQRKGMQWLAGHQDVSNMEVWRKKQLFAIATFYYAAEGPSWPFGIGEDWLDDTRSECHWFSNLFGVFGGGRYQEFESAQGTCNDKGEFIALVFVGSKHTSFSLQNGKLPPEISLLTALETIQVRHHNYRNTSLENAFPPELLQLSKLTTLHYSFTQLTGTIPSYLGLMTNLKELYLSHNDLTGQVPTELGLLTNLQSQFGLSSNMLEGPIPSQLGRLTNVSGFYLDDNTLSASIPTELGLLEQVRSMRLGSNSLLTGPIPSQLGLLALQELHLASTGLSGSVPTELSSMPNLSRLELQDNPALTGWIPNDLCDLEQPTCTYTIPAYFSMVDSGLVEEEETCGLQFDCSPSLCGCSCQCQEG